MCFKKKASADTAAQQQAAEETAQIVEAEKAEVIAEISEKKQQDIFKELGVTSDALGKYRRGGKSLRSLLQIAGGQGFISPLGQAERGQGSGRGFS